MKKIIVDGFTRVSKATAFKLYKEGKTIYITPVNVMPNALWKTATPIRASETPRRWEDRISDFEGDYCDEEVGRYAAFYVK